MEFGERKDGAFVIDLHGGVSAVADGALFVVQLQQAAFLDC